MALSAGLNIGCFDPRGVCHEAQGYLDSEPVLPEAISDLLQLKKTAGR